MQCRRPMFDPWVGKIPWSRAWQPTPVSLPGESHGQRSLVGYSPWGHKRVGPDWATNIFIFTTSTIHLISMRIRSLSWPNCSWALLSSFSIIHVLQSPVLARILSCWWFSPKSFTLNPSHIWPNPHPPLSPQEMSDHFGLPLARILLGQFRKE